MAGGLVALMVGALVSQVAAVAEPDLSRGAGLVGGDFRISCAAATASEFAPAVAYGSAANQYLVAWEDSRDYGTRGTDIYGRRVVPNV